MAEQNGKLSGGEMNSPFLKKWENIWYYHKWHIILGALAVVVLIVTLVQCSNNGKGNDGHYVYAGGHSVLSETRRDIENTMSLFAVDSNGDGKLILAMGNYAIYTQEQINSYRDDERGHVAQMSYDNRKAFDQEILSGDAAICFLSPELFETVAKEGAFIPVSGYAVTVPEGAELVSYGGVAYGVRLSSLAVGAYPGLSSLPADTVLCVRTKSVFGRGEIYDANLEIVWKMLAAAPYVVE